MRTITFDILISIFEMIHPFAFSKISYCVDSMNCYWLCSLIFPLELGTYTDCTICLSCNLLHLNNSSSFSLTTFTFIFFWVHLPSPLAYQYHPQTKSPCCLFCPFHFRVYFLSSLLHSFFFSLTTPTFDISISSSDKISLLPFLAFPFPGSLLVTNRLSQNLMLFGEAT